MAYSGDIVQLQADNPHLEFVYPEEGAMLFTDNMMIPAKAAHPYAAETMMNYVYDPEVAAKLAAYINYISPVKGAEEIIQKTDPKLAANPLIFPPDDDPQEAPPVPVAVARGRARRWRSGWPRSPARRQRCCGSRSGGGGSSCRTCSWGRGCCG